MKINKEEGKKIKPEMEKLTMLFNEFSSSMYLKQCNGVF